MSDPTGPARRLNGDDTDPHLDGLEVNGDDGYDSDPADASSLVEVGSDDFPTYFEERDGRLYTTSSSPYPLPVDTPEQERLNLLHDLLLNFFGANYIGPVGSLLQFSESDRNKKVLDLCTGTGKWVMEMAAEFPRVLFRGFDIVPIATRYPSPNVQFEVDDVNSRFRWSERTFDLVNARAIAMAVRDYPQVLEEVVRVLRPGGLFISYEWATFPAFDPSLRLDPATHAPASSRFHDAINGALLQRRGLRSIAARVSSFLAGAGAFVEISPAQFHIPIGTWPTDPSLQGIGAACLQANVRYAQSVKPFLLEFGWAEVDVDTMLEDYIQEIRTLNGLVSVLYTVHARRA